MSRYNIFQALYMSFYSKSLYRDVAKNWGGKAFLYLLFLVALSWVIQTAMVQIAISKMYNMYGDQFISQFPMLKFTQGKLSTPENKQYVIKSPVTNQDVILIDTTGKTTSLSQTNVKMLVTDSEIISQTKENEIRTDKFPPNLNLDVDPKKVEGYIGHYLGFLWIFIFIFAVIGAYIFRLLQAIIYAIFGKLFALIGSVPVTYPQILQIAMVAITPCVVLNTLLYIVGVEFPFQGLGFFILAMLYIIFGLSANKNVENVDKVDVVQK